MLVLTQVEDGVLNSAVFKFCVSSKFSGASPVISQSQFINIVSPRFGISLLKQISSEDVLEVSHLY
jgi:hypothetical protein